MKKLFLLTLIYLTTLVLSFGQTVSITGGKAACYNCTPNGWSPSFLKDPYPAVSTISTFGSSQLYPWVTAPLPASPALFSTFMTVLADPNVIGPTPAFTTIYNLVPGHQYKFTFHIMTAKYIEVVSQQSPSLNKISDYAGSASYSIDGLPDVTILFDQPNVNNRDKWLKQEYIFTAKSSSHKFTIRANPWYQGTNRGAVNVDVGENAVVDLSCLATTTPKGEPGKGTLSNSCPTKTINLYAALANSPNPPGTTLVFFDNNKHEGNPLLNGLAAPSTPGLHSYYAYYYDAVNDCYSNPLWIQVELKNCVTQVCDAGSSQVSLDAQKTTLFPISPSTTVNLNDAFAGDPFTPVPSKPWVYVAWFDNPTHSGDPINGGKSVPPIVSAGTYYAFYFQDSYGGCYNTDNSTAKVEVKNCYAGNQQVFEAKTLTSVCPTVSIDLNKALSGAPVAGTQVVWFDNPTHTGQAMDANAVAAAQPGTYYAFLWDSQHNCYNTDNSTAKVTAVVPCPSDLTLTVDINEVNLDEGASRDFVVHVWNTQSNPTSTPIEFKIAKIDGFKITTPGVNSVSNVFGGTANENGDWLLSFDNDYIIVKSKPGSQMGPSGHSVIGFTITRNAGVPSGATRKIVASITPNSGGDTDETNNTVMTAIGAN
ncbi:hypothetical protein FEM33_04880 [Dyadobacter flavalbus]|uniref:CARDB domain-containing protein n=1 Tax=Dyadobacter flavalbus TaxID=2579942 RepID=A0A5M8QX66_9BACT|nr:hypothetical protein [Dyadobacter flavalbus]KAA6440867.1 hypothetical protein FEM33_04880 [Dyadobacter flavalbus]